MIDTHCHLDMEDFDSDRDEVIKRAEDARIKYIINAGSDREGNIRGLELSDKYPIIYSAAGIHPHNATSLDESLYSELGEWIKRPKVVAVGEIGLDYHYLHSPKGAQIEAFKKQIALAKEARLPVIIHSRDAKNDTIRVLKEEMTDISGVLHCFSGDIEMANKAMESGLLISIAGPVTFKNVKDLREVIRFIPDDFLLMETDAPYLSPVPVRGRRNEPSFLKYTAEVIAEIRGINVSDLARITTLNAMRLFKIGDVTGQGEIAYRIRDSLYLNITNRCTNKCGFCIRSRTSYVKGHNLRLQKEPSALQVIKAIKDPKVYKEIVFCGIGEPLLRLDLVKKVAAWVKQNGGRVRINTNGQGNLIHGKNILPELKGIVDSLSISLDAEDEKKYEKICRPSMQGAYESVVSFTKEAVKVIPEVKVTVVGLPGIDIEKCKKIAGELGVELRVRKLNEVG
ncbi:MAG: YchF/TatD family DNA exonuclease [Nitrospiraceae bacterium]|nr:MAG: YchF/TatD family DNA exonuclease [Nitrospiraceae bacterium]